MASSSSCAAPETIYLKANPCCTLIQPIATCESIGSSLPAIQFNFSNLDAHTCNLETSARELWNPIYSLISSSSSRWVAAYNVVQSMSAAWNSAYTTVASYSAAWIEPISVIYSSTFNEGEIDTNIIKAWADENFPITTPGQLNTCSDINFAPGQKMWVFCGTLAAATQSLFYATPDVPQYTSTTVDTTRSTAAAQGSCTFNGATLAVWMLTINHGAGSYSNLGQVAMYDQVDWQVSTNVIRCGDGAWLAGAAIADVSITAGGSGAVTTTTSVNNTNVTTVASEDCYGSYTDKYLGGFRCLEYIVSGGEWVFNVVRY